MAIVTVYAFKYYDPKNDLFKMGKGMTTKEEISKIADAEIILSSAREVDDSELTQSRRFYKKSD